MEKIKCYKLAYPFHPNWLISCPICPSNWEARSGDLALQLVVAHVNFHIWAVEVMTLLGGRVDEAV